jgi:hypothetical protein
MCRVQRGLQKKPKLYPVSYPRHQQEGIAEEERESYNILPFSRSCIQESIPSPAEEIHGFSFAHKLCLAKFGSNLKSTEYRFSLWDGLRKKKAYLARRRPIPPLLSIPSNKYPISSRNLRVSPLLRSSEILLSGFIVPIGASKEVFKRPFDGETLGDAELGVDARETFGYGSSSELSTPQRERSELYDSRESNSSSRLSIPCETRFDVFATGKGTRNERKLPA